MADDVADSFVVDNNCSRLTWCDLQGVAASNVPSPVWAVVDLYGMTVKVTIVDDQPAIQMVDDVAESIAESVVVDDNRGDLGPLLFDPYCGPHAKVRLGGQLLFEINSKK